MFRQFHLIMRMVASLCLLSGLGVLASGLWRIDSAYAALDAVHYMQVPEDAGAHKPDAPKPVSGELFYAKLSDCRWSLAALRRMDNEPAFCFSGPVFVVGVWPAAVRELPVASAFAFISSMPVMGFVSRAPPRRVAG